MTRMATSATKTPRAKRDCKAVMMDLLWISLRFVFRGAAAAPQQVWRDLVNRAAPSSDQATVISRRTCFSADRLAARTATADFIAFSPPPRTGAPVLTAAQNSASSFL